MDRYVPCRTNVDRIPEYIGTGYVNLGPSYRGKAYVDYELKDVDTGVPPVDGETTDPWTSAPPEQRVCDTAGENDVHFTVRRWTRGNAAETIEFWVAAGDFFYAHRRGPWYLIVACITGHPIMVTPCIDWGNSDGSTFPATPTFKVVEELIVAMTALGREFVQNQIH